MFNVLAKVALINTTYEISLNWIGKLIKLLIESIGSVGVGIIIFSLILKFIVMPFDVIQRISMRRQNNMMKENEAKMKKLQKQYANNKEMYAKKVNEMYKASGISMLSSCLPMILSIVVFIVAINAFNAYATYSAVHNYNDMVSAYNQSIVRQCDGIYEKSEYGYIITGADADEKAETIQQTAKEAVKTAYDKTISKRTNFLWIKNIWVTDSSFKHPIPDHENFIEEVKRQKFEVKGEKVKLESLKTSAYDKDNYNKVTANLTQAKAEPNGYFILIALSIAVTLLQQWISNKAQKEQQQFATVDGQSATQQKTMMVMMTIMFAVFAFLYSASFSIYMITSNLMSMLSTFVITKVVDYTENKRELKLLQEKYNKRFPGRAPSSDKEETK